jgi:hypothetical protein
MFGRETPNEEIDLPIEDHLLVIEDTIWLRGARPHVVLNHIQRELKSQGAVRARWAKRWLSGD